jgi:hypothetical protein
MTTPATNVFERSRTRSVSARAESVFAADVLYLLLDPRIRYGAGE